MNVVFVFGQVVHLTLNEYPILYALMSLPEGHWLGREKLLDAIGDTGEMNDRTIDTIIKRLRLKLFPKNKTARLNFIETRYGQGYRIANRAK